MLIYQFGAISYYYNKNELWKAKLWREQQKYYFYDLPISYGFKFFNPVNDFEINIKNANQKSIVDQNRYYLQKADILTGCLDHIMESPGSMWEMFLASEMKKPVLTFGDISIITNPHILNSITQHFNTMDEMCEYMIDMYGQSV